MADNITPSAAFATAFMKPVPGETIDAIYGRKVADNTGYLYFNRIIGPTIDLNLTPAASLDYFTTGTKYFISENKGTIYGTFTLSSYTQQSGKLFEGSVYVDGTFVAGTGGTSAVNGTVTLVRSFSHALSNLSDLSQYKFSGKLFGQGVTGGANTFGLSVSSFIRPQ